MIVRRYQSEDYDQVYVLVAKTMPRKLPEKLGGCGVVIEIETKIVAFCWALTAPDSDIACVEFFAVAPELRDQKMFGPLVITRLLMELQKAGAKEVVGLLADSEQYTESLVRIYNEVGMVANHGYVVNGDIQRVLEGIRHRYGGKNEFIDNAKN